MKARIKRFSSSRFKLRSLSAITLAYNRPWRKLVLETTVKADLMEKLDASLLKRLTS